MSAGKIEALKQAYAKSLTTKLATLEQLYQHFIEQTGDEPVKALHVFTHNLSGSAGLYGYPEVATQSKALMQIVETSYEVEALPETQAEFDCLKDALQQAIQEKTN